MGEWERTTQSCGWEELPTELLDQYAERHGGEDLTANSLACVRTVSTPVKRRLLGASKTDLTVIGVTGSYLVWSGGSGADPFISAARLDQIELRDYTPGLIEDTGIEVLGFRLGGTERESWFLPLDDGRDAREFRRCLANAVADAQHRRPPKQHPRQDSNLRPSD